MKFTIYLLLFSFLIFSCARNVTSGRSGDSSGVEDYEESLTGVRPNTKTLKEPVRDRAGEKEMERNAYVPESLKSDNVMIDKVLEDISKHNSSITELPGYRLQIFSGNSREDFEIAKSYILQHYPELEIYESYSQPTYRVKVGDFLKKMDADKYYSSIVSRFSSSKVVMDNVDVQKSLKIN